MCHQRILLSFNLLYLRLTCTVSNADSVSWQMVFLTATALAAFRVPHTLLFPLTYTFSPACCERMGELSWEASLLLELPFSCSVSGCRYPLCLFGLDWSDLKSFLPFVSHSCWYAFFPCPFCCSIGSEGCSAVQGDCSAHFACSSDNWVVRDLTVSCSAIRALFCCSITQHGQ